MKPFIYAPIPEFNQETQYVKQSTPIDMGDYIFVGLEIRGVATDDIEEEIHVQ